MKEPIDHYIRKCIENDRGGQQKIYQLFSPVLYGLCLKYMKNEDDAKDVFQEAFVIAFQKMNQYRFEGSFEGWLKRIFINKLIETLNKRKRDVLFRMRFIKIIVLKKKLTWIPLQYLKKNY